MTAASLFDVLARESNAGAGDTSQLSTLLTKMIAESLASLSNLRGYEQDLALHATKDSETELELRQTIWQLYSEWKSGAEAIFQRASKLRGGGLIDGLSRLNDEIGRIDARLTVSPEQLFNARQQARNGDVTSARELRDELNARLRG